jgi:hypothetical protein
MGCSASITDTGWHGDVAFHASDESTVRVVLRRT